MNGNKPAVWDGEKAEVLVKAFVKVHSIDNILIYMQRYLYKGI